MSRTYYPPKRYAADELHGLAAAMERDADPDRRRAARYVRQAADTLYEQEKQAREECDAVQHVA